MDITLNGGQINVVIVPCDLRAGFNRLSRIASQYLNVSVNKG